MRLKYENDQRYSERDLVEEVEGIGYINSLELPPDDDSTASGRSFCPLTSYCSHHCANNTFRTRSYSSYFNEISCIVGSNPESPLIKSNGFRRFDERLGAVVQETRAKFNIAGEFAK